MGRKPIFIDAEAFLRDISARFDNEEFMQDFFAFLYYVRRYKVRLTPKDRWIPMKHLYAINSILRNPLKLDDKVRGKIYKTREEFRAPRIYFIDLLAEASECAVPNDEDILVLGPEYKRFMNMDGFNKKRWLILAWYFHLDWDDWLPEGDFGRTLQARALEIIPHIKEWLRKGGRVHFTELTKNLINDLKLKWNAPSQEHARDNIRWGIERCILRPLTYFDTIDLCYGKEDEYGIKDLNGFYIKPFGRAFLDELIKVGEHLKNKPIQ